MPTEPEARALMAENMANNPEFEAGCWYPAEEEYRIVYIDPTALPARPDDRLAVFRMDHQEADGRRVPLLVAFVRPQDVGALPPPTDWGEGVWVQAPLRNAA